MNKEETLLKSFTLLAKDPVKNGDALKSAIAQLFEINPKLGLRCWEECININMDKLKKEFGKPEFDYGDVGYEVIRLFESEFCAARYFENALAEFAKNRPLLEILYTKSPIVYYFSAPCAISFLIRKNRLQEADNILSAIYKNKRFSEYSEMWKCIIEKFEYGDHYNPNAYFAQSLTQPEPIRSFCIGWIERIKDEGERASAMVFAMQMFE